MARTYGLYCYKFIEAMNGDTYRIQFHRENYTGEAFEIEKMGVTPFTINLDGRGDELTRPIVKSSLSIQIIDTEQFDYSIFYTASAFEWKVDLARVYGSTGQRFVWSGYLTPDSYSQACVKGATISLTARDNLGYLDEVDFDGVTYSDSTDYGDRIATVYEVIRSAISVAEPNFNVVYKVATVGDYGLTSLLDLCINTRRFDEVTWGEALAMVLQSFGWQLRPAFQEGYVSDTDLNGSVRAEYEIVDVAYLGDSKSWNTTVTPMFLGNSKQLSILPNWRELAIEQDYGVIDNFFPMPNERDYTSNNYGMPFKSYRRLRHSHYGYSEYDPELWAYPYYQIFASRSATTQQLYCLNARKYANGSLSNTLILANLSRTTTVEKPKLIYTFNNGQVREGSTISIDLTVRKQLYALRNKDITQGTSAFSPTTDTDLVVIPRPANTADTLNCTIMLDLIVCSVDGIRYVATSAGWELYDETADPKIQFTFPSEGENSITSFDPVNQWYDYIYNVLFAKDAAGYNVENFKITATNAPLGNVQLIFYAPNYAQESYALWTSDLVAVIFDNIKAQINPDTAQKGQTMRIVNNLDANVKTSLSVEFGSCPENAGGALTYAGGIYLPYESRGQVNLFARNANEDATSTLSLLTAKALMHHHKKTRNVYSGTIRYDRPYFDALIRIDGKTCVVNSAAYDVLHNQLSGEFIEVEPYIDPAIDLSTDIVNTGSGSTISSGGTSTSTTIVNTGGQTLSTKRIYELGSATADEAKSQYLMVDASGNQEAKKVRVSDLMAGSSGNASVSSLFVLAYDAANAQALSASDPNRIYYTVEE